jgi:hypothetical protein
MLGGAGRRARVVALTVMSAAPAGAQIIGSPTRSGASTQHVWFAGGIGFARMQDVEDGTRADWRFGNGLQYRGAVELDAGRSAALGIAITYAHMPLRYNRLQLTPSTAPCASDCDAHSGVWTMMGTFHSGGEVGFHQVFELSAGAVRYASFTVDSTGAKLPPTGGDTDFAFGLGYGFGFGFSDHAELTIVQDAALTMHQRTGLVGNASSLSQYYSTRIGLRIRSGFTRGK